MWEQAWLPFCEHPGHGRTTPDPQEHTCPKVACVLVGATPDPSSTHDPKLHVCWCGPHQTPARRMLVKVACVLLGCTCASRRVARCTPNAGSTCACARFVVRPMAMPVTRPASGASVLLTDATSAYATDCGSGFKLAPARLYVATTVRPCAGVGAGAGGCAAQKAGQLSSGCKLLPELCPRGSSRCYFATYRAWRRAAAVVPTCMKQSSNRSFWRLRCGCLFFIVYFTKFTSSHTALTCFSLMCKARLASR